MPELNEAVSNLATAFEDFKKVNDQRLAEIEKKGSADPLLEKSLEKINKIIDTNTDIKNRLEKLETRPQGELAESEKSSDEAVLQHKNAFNLFLKRGVESGLAELEKKALSVGSDPDGGYTVTPEMSSTIIKKVFETSPMRAVAKIETISTDSLDILVDNDENTSGWVGETATRSDTDTPTIGKTNIPVHEVYTIPKATQKLLDDSSLNIESWLAEKVSSEMSRKENTAFINGTGTGQPRGILTYTAGTGWGQVEQISSNSSTGGELSADDLVDLVYALKEEYATNGSFMMRRATVGEVRSLKGSDNNYLWVPGLQAGEPDSILGHPVYQASDMPALATNSLSIAFGDFSRAYTVVDRAGIRTLRDPFTDKPYVKFYTTKRVGGDVTNFEAIKLLKMDA